MEAEHHQVTTCADALATPTGATGLGGVLDDAQLVLCCQRVQSVQVHRQSGQMHRHDGARFVVDGARGLVQIEVARHRVHIGKYRRGPHLQDDAGCGHPGQWRGDDFIARAYAGHAQRHFQGGGPRVVGAHRATTAVFRQSLLECTTLAERAKAMTGSNVRLCGPVVIQPERSTSATPAIVSSSMSGRVKGRKSSVARLMGRCG